MKIYLLITSSLGLFIAIFIIWLIRKDHLHVRYAFGWIIIGLLSALLGFFPGLMDLVARYLNIGYPPILAVVIAISFMLIKMLLMDIERSRQTRDIIRLNQRVGILEAQLHNLQKNTGINPVHTTMETPIKNSKVQNNVK
jgi:hypothetical protein